MSQSSSEDEVESSNSILFFYSKSADKAPGKGANETLNSSDDFSKLSKIKNWRKILSNFHIGTFTYKDNKTYRTVEHCFHAQKIALASPEKAHEFSLESKSKLSKGDGEAARKQRKIVMLNDQQVREWNRKKFILLEEMLFCKFSQNEEARKVLLATGNAELWHGTRGAPKARQIGLENVRKRIRESEDQNDQNNSDEVDEESEKNLENNDEEEGNNLKRKRPSGSKGNNNKKRK